MYTQEVKLADNESVMKVNKETGEIKEVVKRPNNIPEGKEIWQPNALFKKSYTKTWDYLEKELSALEFKAAFSMGMMAKANTNSLEPLNSETAFKELAEVLNVSKNKIKGVIEKLAYYGVFGEFSIINKDDPNWMKYWIFNPYLSFSGQLINSDIPNLFSKTRIADAFFKEDI